MVGNSGVDDALSRELEAEKEKARDVVCVRVKVANNSSIAKLIRMKRRTSGLMRR
jgi:hypothetical protein